jgi:Domain of unknown function (DUF5667)
VRWFASGFISAPLATTAAIFVFVLGGWLTTVNAASSSLPGDALYRLKLITEQAQLQVASLEDRAVLHTEFAQRRLSEAVAMGNSQDPERDTYVSSTLQAYKKEMSLAEGDLRELSSSGSAQTVEVAAAIDQKITQLNTVIDSSVSTDGTTEAKDVTDSASQAVVDALVDSHDSQTDNVPSADLRKLFRDQLADIEHRQTFDLGRIAKIRAVLAAHPDLTGENIPQEDVLMAFEEEITAASREIPEAMDILVNGEKRIAFDKLAAMKASLKEIEARIAEQEILITQAIAVEASLVAPEESEDVEETEPSS